MDASTQDCIGFAPLGGVLDEIGEACFDVSSERCVHSSRVEDADRIERRFEPLMKDEQGCGQRLKCSRRLVPATKLGRVPAVLARPLAQSAAVFRRGGVQPAQRRPTRSVTHRDVRLRRVERTEARHNSTSRLLKTRAARGRRPERSGVDQRCHRCGGGARYGTIGPDRRTTARSSTSMLPAAAAFRPIR
jgi:hypothetical protein